MSKIPEDIMNVTNKLVNDYVNPHEPRPDFRPDLRKRIAAALLAERERCLEAVRQVKTDVGVYVRRSDILDAISTDTFPATGGWQPIETAAAAGKPLLLYFPADAGRNSLPQMMRIEHYPCSFPRKPTHWQPLPSPPPPVRETP